MSLISRISTELGFTTILQSPRDVTLLLATRLIRMFAYGSSTLILALYFSALGHSDTLIGLFMTLTLVGDVLISLVLTLFADRLGRRRILLLGALLMCFSGVIFATCSNYWILLAAAVLGVISPSGNEIGPFRAVEESTLAGLVDAKGRGDVFAWYVVFGTLGTAGGSLTAGWMTQSVQTKNAWSEIESFRLVFWMYAVIGLVKAGTTWFLSGKCEVQRNEREAREQESVELSTTGEGGDEQQPFLAGDEEEDEEGEEQTRAKTTPPAKENATPKKIQWFQLSAKSRRTLAKLCGLFFFDSLASGMVPGSLIAYYISSKFGMPEGTLGTIMASAQFVSSMGNMLANSVAKRIGLVRTMVFTHLPSAIFLALIPAPSSLVFTIILLVARSTLSAMDQAPRSAFLSAIVLPEERTAVMGIVNTVKTMSQSSGPLITGFLAGDNRFWIAFVIAGCLKASYDLAMLSMFASTHIEGDRSARAKSPDIAAEGVEDHFELESDDDEAASSRNLRGQSSS